MGKRHPAVLKVVDEEFSYGRRSGEKLRFEVWQSSNGDVVRYNLAYVDTAYSAVDNGRVLGYDNQHGYHHRHFKGKEEPWSFGSFEELVEQFRREVEELRRQK